MAKQIPLSGKNGEGKFALVDDEDFAAASAYTWYLHGHERVVTNGERRKFLFLHHLIFGNPPADLVVDHIDGNPLNNQRANLRWATHAQSMQNRGSYRDSSSRFKGVHWVKGQRLWQARIQSNKKQIRLGFFTSELDAARAYNEAAVQYHGEYARLNIIPDDATEPVRYRQAVPVARSRTSKYRGVSFPPDKKRWQAIIGVKGKNIYLGYFDIEEEAARAYDAAAKLYKGDRAFLNFPDMANSGTQGA